MPVIVKSFVVLSRLLILLQLVLPACRQAGVF